MTSMSPVPDVVINQPHGSLNRTWGAWGAQCRPRLVCPKPLKVSLPPSGSLQALDLLGPRSTPPHPPPQPHHTLTICCTSLEFALRKESRLFHSSASQAPWLCPGSRNHFRTVWIYLWYLLRGGVTWQRGGMACSSSPVRAAELYRR